MELWGGRTCLIFTLKVCVFKRYLISKQSQGGTWLIRSLHVFEEGATNSLSINSINPYYFVPLPFLEPKFTTKLSKQRFDCQLKLFLHAVSVLSPQTLDGWIDKQSDKKKKKGKKGHLSHLTTKRIPNQTAPSTTLDLGSAALRIYINRCISMYKKNQKNKMRYIKEKEESWISNLFFMQL